MVDIEEMSEYGFTRSKPERVGGAIEWMPYAKLALALVALIIAYLFTLNGRYHFVDDNNMVADKWTGNIGYIVLDDEIDWGN